MKSVKHLMKLSTEFSIGRRFKHLNINHSWKLAGYFTSLRHRGELSRRKMDTYNWEGVESSSGTVEPEPAPVKFSLRGKRAEIGKKRRKLSAAEALEALEADINQVGIKICAGDSHSFWRT